VVVVPRPPVAGCWQPVPVGGPRVRAAIEQRGDDLRVAELRRSRDADLAVRLREAAVQVQCAWRAKVARRVLCSTKDLKEGEAAVDAADHEACTALHHGAEVLAVVEVLLAHGADPNHADTRGWTPMHKAASVGSLPALRAMRNIRPPRQGTCNNQDKTGWTCLHWYAI
jgi:hypothetical protein